MESNKEMEKRLKEPFELEHIEWRVQKAGDQTDKKTGEKKYWAMVLAYVTNRAIMDRLDEVFGINGWNNDFMDAPDGGILCGITALGVTKWDGADKTSIEATKGGLSNAMKRAAVQWGIGRYLYDLETNFVSLSPDRPTNMKGYGIHYDKETKKRFYYKHPELPEFARPSSKDKS